ncbi:hypothetical protein J132_06853 [Termitomyces sp. J132]|nr:hypothetical protein J132_06853 [Termitomyces sp. J132]
MPELQQVWNVIPGKLAIVYRYDIDADQMILGNRLLQEETDYDVEELKRRVDENKARFNGEQLGAFNEVINSVDNNLGKMIIVHSAGRCSKTFICNTLASAVQSNRDVALCVASSGIAALLLEGGRTAHSRFKIPIPALDISIANIKRGMLWIHPLPISKEELNCLNSYSRPKLSSGMKSQCNTKLPLTLWIEG